MVTKKMKKSELIFEFFAFVFYIMHVISKMQAL